MACVGIVGLAARLAVGAELESQAKLGTEAEANALMDEYVHGGRADLDAALAGRLRNGENPYRYTVAATRADPASVGDGTTPPHRAFHPVAAERTIGNDVRLTVSDNLARATTVMRAIDRAFLSALGIAAVLGLCAGGLLSNTLLGRLDRVTRAADAVAAGDLATRMPLDGTGDEFDRLATTLNRMLDRICDLLDDLRQVSNGVAHDLRTPMSRLRQGLEAARRRGTTVADFEEAVDRAVMEADGILDIFAALLRIAQVEGGSRRAGFRMVDLSGAAQEVADVYAAAAEDEGRTLVADVTEGISVEGDRELLVQLLSNLVENALQHAPGSKRIGLGVALMEGFASVWVADDGAGIPPPERDKVLRRFHRLDRSRSGEGHGLGLCLVAAVVDLHGGALTLSDNAPGLRVEVRLPVSVAGRRSLPSPTGCGSA